MCTVCCLQNCLPRSRTTAVHRTNRFPSECSFPSSLTHSASRTLPSLAEWRVRTCTGRRQRYSCHIFPRARIKLPRTSPQFTRPGRSFSVPRRAHLRVSRRCCDAPMWVIHLLAQRPKSMLPSAYKRTPCGVHGLLSTLLTQRRASCLPPLYPRRAYLTDSMFARTCRLALIHGRSLVA